MQILILGPDCYDSANNFFALVYRDGVSPQAFKVVRFFYLRELHKFFDADAATGIEKCKPEFHLSQTVSNAPIF